MVTIYKWWLSPWKVSITSWELESLLGQPEINLQHVFNIWELLRYMYLNTCLLKIDKMASLNTKGVFIFHYIIANYKFFMDFLCIAWELFVSIFVNFSWNCLWIHTKLPLEQKTPENAWWVFAHDHIFCT